MTFTLPFTTRTASLLPVGEGLEMRACKVEQTIARNVAEILKA